MKKKSLLVSAIAAHIAALPVGASADITDTDIQNMLHNIYNSTGGGSWTASTGWSAADPIACSAVGLVCDVDDNLISIDLSGNGLSGSLSSFIDIDPADTFLETIDLSDNNISWIDTLEDLEALRTLDISDNNIASLPWIYNNENLEVFDMSGNNLTGNYLSGVPNSLTSLDLSGNSLSGSLNSALYYMPDGLQTLDISDNDLSGSLPSTMPADLVTLDISGNSMSDLYSISSLANSDDLITLDLSDNNFYGSLPSGNTFKNLEGLETLDLSGNGLSGLIAPEIGEIGSLKSLKLAGNGFSGEIPIEILDLTNLDDDTGLDIDWNALFSDDTAVTDFVNAKGTNPLDTQTVAPVLTGQADADDPEAEGDQSRMGYSLSWAVSDTNPVRDGGYQLQISPDGESGWTSVGSDYNPTADKTTILEYSNDTEDNVQSVTEGEDYFFRIRAFTDNHEDNDNTVYSAYSETLRISLNDVPVANAGEDQTVQEGTEVELSASATDYDQNDYPNNPNSQQPFSFSWEQTSGVPVVLDGANTATPSFFAPSDFIAHSVTFEVSVTDTNNHVNQETGTDTVTVNITKNGAPVVDAGPDQLVVEGTVVGLAATVTDDAEDLEYEWKQLGDKVVITDRLTANPSFTAPMIPEGELGVELEFELTVTDQGGLSSTDTVTIYVGTAEDVAEVLAGPTQQVVFEDKEGAPFGSLGMFTLSLLSLIGLRRKK